MPRARVRRRRFQRDETTPSCVRRVTHVAGAAIAVLLASGLGAQSAGAGLYVMRNCDVPGHANALLGAWRTSEMAPNAVLVDACANGGGVGFTFAGAPEMPPGSWATLLFSKPRTGPQSQIKLVKATLWYAARLAGSGQQINLSSLGFHSDNTFYFGVSNGPPGAENLVLEQQFEADTAYYKVGVVCGPTSGIPGPESCLPSATMPFQVRGMEITLSEDVPPIVSPPGGTLLEGGPQSGVRTVTYSAFDPQSGLAKVEVLFDDTVVASRDLTTRCAMSDLTVCPASDDGTLSVDTSTVSNGSHRMTLRVQDAAGNQRVADMAGAVEIANQAVPRGPSGPSSVPTLIARFKGSSRSTLTVPYGRRVSLRGQLTDVSQSGPGGAQIEVLERPEGRGAREVAAGRTQTNPDGTFAFVLLGHRPSRTVRLTYRSAAGAQAVSDALKLRVRAASSLGASLRGRVIRFRGRVRSGPIPRRGKTVRMEGRAPGSSWTSFDIRRTDRKGRFFGTYRLPIRRPGVKLKIRVAVPSERGYGYVTARSRTVTLRVR